LVAGLRPQLATSFRVVMACGPTMARKVGVILTLSRAKGKDLQFRSGANQCRFFASLRMTGETSVQ